MHDDSTVYVIDKLNEFSEKEIKIPKRENGDVDDSNSAMSSQSQQVFQVLKKYKVPVTLYSSNIRRSNYYNHYLFSASCVSRLVDR